MATGRKTVVVGQVIDPNTWGNLLWDQSVQSFASAADRLAQFAAPLAGAVTWLDDVKQLQRYNGTAWHTVLVGNGGKVTATTDVNGVILIPHLLGVAPRSGSVMLGGGNAVAVNQVGKVVLSTIDATNLGVNIYRSDTGAALATTVANLYWEAFL